MKITLNKLSQLKAAKKYMDNVLNPPSDEFEEERLKCEDSLEYFLKKSWQHFQGNDNFIPSIATEAMAEHLEAAYRRELKILLINVPPGESKTSLISVAFNAWAWAKDPNLRFITASYSSDLSLKNASDARALIQSEWYRNLWGHKFILTKDDNNKTYFLNDRRGWRLSTSVQGTITGYHADFVLIDDPNNTKRADSEAFRKSTNEWWTSAVPTRHRDVKKFVRIVVQQRLHENDLSGHILSSGEDVVHLRLPREFESNARCSTIILPSSAPKVWTDPRTKEGQLLNPARYNTSDIERMNKGLSEYHIASQYQQRPAPAEGGKIKREWFMKYEQSMIPRLDYVIQSWDTALTTGVDSCFSACTTWGIFKNDRGRNAIILLNCFSAKVEYPELRKLAQRKYLNCYDDDLSQPRWDGGIKSDVVLIEQKVNGISLLQNLRAAGIPTIGFNPNKFGSKETRALQAAALIESGMVYLPTKSPTFTTFLPHAQKLVEACAMFPHGNALDIVDSMSQALIWLENRGLVRNKHNFEDPDSEEDFVIKTRAG
jgi:predicted phage terminase large subunit-like protein